MKDLKLYGVAPVINQLKDHVRHLYILQTDYKYSMDEYFDELLETILLDYLDIENIILHEKNEFKHILKFMFEHLSEDKKNEIKKNIEEEIYFRGNNDLNLIYAQHYFELSNI